jgi:hypothetical protein
MPFIRILIASLLAGLPVAGMAACVAQSGEGVTALVELYTSEGCSSCPPADRQLAQLRPGKRLVPLALHVDYWDDLGWHDPYAQEAFDRRQAWLVQVGGGRTVYTPQFFVGGEDVRPATLDGRVRELNAHPARASLRLKARVQDSDTLSVSASAQSSVDGAELYLAVAENGLSSQVGAGENGGRRLSHDHLARAWVGPWSLQEGSLELRRNVPLAKTWQRARLEVIAFVQDRHTGRVLQAVGTGRCVGS